MNNNASLLRLFICIGMFFCLFDALLMAENRSLNILVIETSFPPETSTAGLNQIVRLIKDGHNVDIYAAQSGLMKWAHPDVKTYKLMDHFINKLERETLHKYDVIYCMFGHRANEFIEFLGDYRLPSTKIVVCFRGSDITKYLQKSSHSYAKLFAKADLFLPVCHYFKNKLIKLGCKSNKIVVFPSTIDCSFFKYRERAVQPGGIIKLVSVSRLTKKKGLEYAINAVAQLAQKYPHIEYKIAGFGDLEKNH